MFSMIRIWFADNVWSKLYQPIELPKIVMSGTALKARREQLGLSIKSMAKILCVDVTVYKAWELNGLRAPHDTEGPASRLVEILIMTKETQEILGYNGPDKRGSF